MMIEDQEALEAMLVEVRRIREELSVLSESTKAITKAIEGVLGDKVAPHPDGPGYIEDGDFHYEEYRGQQ
jgi:hypothetical protein